MIPEDVSYVNKGIDQYQKGNYEEAIEFFNKALEINRKNENTWCRKGLALSDIGKYKEALKAYNEAIKIKPEHGRAWHNKGVALYKLLKYKKAIKAYNKAIAINKVKEIKQVHAMPWIYKGFLYCEFKKYEEALKAIENAIKIYENDKIIINIITKPNRALAWTTKGIILSKLGKCNEAIKAFEEASHIAPEEPLIHTELGEHFLKLGNLENSSKKVKDALTINENYTPALYLLGRIKIEEQDYISAISAFNKAITLDCESNWLLLWESYASYLHAEFSSNLDDKKKIETTVSIIRKLEKAEKISEKYVDGEAQASILYFLGYLYYKSKDIFTAKEKLEKCVRVKSSSSIKSAASELLKYIWNYQIRPTWFDWWLASPLHRQTKRSVFIIISLLVSALFLAHPFIPMWFPELQINWTLYVFFITLLVFIIASPNIERIKAKEIDIKMRTPLHEFVLSAVNIEEKIKDS